MTAPIVVEFAPSAPDPELSRATIDACSAAAGPGGCVLDGEPQAEARARVVVTFSSADDRVRVELVASSAGGAGQSREVSFREDDPRLERFRATGLIVAGLVSDRVLAESPGDSPPSAPLRGEARRRVLVRLEGQSGWNGARAWIGAGLGADLSVASPVFVALSGTYDQTWARDTRGIVAQRTALGLGAGVAAPFAGDRVELRVRVALELEELRASVHQPITLREDDAGRALSGIEGSMDLVLPVAPSFDVFCGGRADWWGGTTTVRVAGALDEIIGAWMASFAAGVNVRFQ